MRVLWKWRGQGAYAENKSPKTSPAAWAFSSQVLRLTRETYDAAEKEAKAA